MAALSSIVSLHVLLPDGRVLVSAASTGNPSVYNPALMTAGFLDEIGSALGLSDACFVKLSDTVEASSSSSSLTMIRRGLVRFFSVDDPDRTVVLKVSGRQVWSLLHIADVINLGRVYSEPDSECLVIERDDGSIIVEADPEEPSMWINEDDPGRTFIVVDSVHYPVSL